jgi:phosphotransferase system HPr (HPr) family protein
MGTLSEVLIRRIEITMPSELGFHLRVVARFIKYARESCSTIHIRNGNITADGKSMMGLLLLGTAWKSTIEIIVVGDDAVKESESIQQFFSNPENRIDAT